MREWAPALPSRGWFTFTTAGGPGLSADRRAPGRVPGAVGRSVIRSSELRTNLAAKRVPSFLDEVRPLLGPGVAYDPVAALDWVETTFIPLLP